MNENKIVLTKDENQKSQEFNEPVSLVVKFFGKRKNLEGDNESLDLRTESIRIKIIVDGHTILNETCSNLTKNQPQLHIDFEEPFEVKKDIHFAVTNLNPSDEIEIVYRIV